MKINDVIVEANKRIINLNMFLYSCIGTFLMNTAIGVVASTLILVCALLIKLFNNIVFGAILTFLAFLITGLVYVALTYGVVIYIYGLSCGKEAHPADIFKNAMSKAQIVITVFFRVISRFIIEIIVLIVSGIATCAAFLAGLAVFIKFLFEGFFEIINELAGIENSTNFEELISILVENSNKILVVLVVSAGVFILTSLVLFIRKISYSLTDFLIYENDEYNSMEIVKKSKELMKGKKLTYFGISILPYLLTIAFGIVYFALHISVLASATVFSIVNVAATTYAFILQVAFYRILKDEQ